MFKLWSNIKNNWNACGLDIYLKSGQVIHLDRVWEYKFEINRGRALYELRYGPHLPDMKTKDRLDALLDILLDDERITTHG